MQIFIKYGIISEIDATKGLAKVTFQADDNIVSAFIPALVRKTLTEKESFPYDANEYVACIMDEHCEHGVIVGAVYNETDKPAFTSKDVFGIKFANGDSQSYDRSSGVYSFNGGNNGGIPILQKILDNLTALKTYCTTQQTALDAAFAAIGVGSAASGPNGATAYNSAMAANTITFENMENTKLTH